MLSVTNRVTGQARIAAVRRGSGSLAVHKLRRSELANLACRAGAMAGPGGGGGPYLGHAIEAGTAQVQRPGDRGRAKPVAVSELGLTCLIRRPLTVTTQRVS